ncbi:SMP-30/gluconolactonase/LRE family protein [Thermoleptolyngbya sp. C42_A2020_037]|uniref:SMP-30/gluconolactonase/LRE family protein n=1 Tax=Thermoleptolyngbya sp. C42_A2020_037 TaxID=2747799 RepID=UPI0019E516D5|nr:SMP-30/gluconolactonase/LRE family protein [Thermoleptolyngbya sp. C42_A2020_037]MBF2085318.1 SMP-30/gluconolactonase/LRE family protein [Thermoleptolyngbya sp. C42_A2020_037]
MNPTATAVQNVLNARARLGECPLWDWDAQLLYWVDIYNHRVHQFDPATGRDRFFDVGDVVSAIALAGEQQILMALGNRLALLDTQSGTQQTLYTAEFDCPGTRFNDGKCDAQGRFWIGSISPEPGQAALYRYDPDGSWQTMETGLTISNGLGWNPAGDTFYLTDSPQRKIFAYRFDAATGTIGDRQVLVDLGDEPVEPDGLAIDTQGNLWSALWDGWCVVKCDATGRELQRIPLPVQRPTCPIFGGAGLTDLYITTASVGLSQAEIQAGFYAGDLFCLQTDVTGLPAHRFGRA